MKLTHSILHSAGSNGCGFNRQQLELLGVKWPPTKGWLSGLIGVEVPDADWNLVMRLKSVRSKRERERILTESLT